MPLPFTGATAQNAYSTEPTEKDPYVYQVGFGNRFASEAMCVRSLGMTREFADFIQPRGASARTESTPEEQVWAVH